MRNDKTRDAVNRLLKVFGVEEPVVPTISPKPDTYLVRYFCDNCRRGSTIRFKKGQVAPDGGLKCPHCELRQTRKLTAA